MASCGMSCVKYLVFVFNFLFAVSNNILIYLFVYFIYILVIPHWNKITWIIYFKNCGHKDHEIDGNSRAGGNGFGFIGKGEPFWWIDYHYM